MSHTDPILFKASTCQVERSLFVDCLYVAAEESSPNFYDHYDGAILALLFRNNVSVGLLDSPNWPTSLNPAGAGAGAGIYLSQSLSTSTVTMPSQSIHKATRQILIYNNVFYRCSWAIALVRSSLRCFLRVLNNSFVAGLGGRPDSASILIVPYEHAEDAAIVIANNIFHGPDGTTVGAGGAFGSSGGILADASGPSTVAPTNNLLMANNLFSEMLSFDRCVFSYQGTLWFYPLVGPNMIGDAFLSLPAAALGDFEPASGMAINGSAVPASVPPMTPVFLPSTDLAGQIRSGQADLGALEGATADRPLGTRFVLGLDRTSEQRLD